VVTAPPPMGIITRSDILDFVLSGAGIKVARGRKNARKKMPPAKRSKRSKAIRTRRTTKIL
jgi:hypothetical protein